MNKQVLDLLMRSFDGTLTLEEAEALEAALVASEEVREERRRLIRLRGTISSARRGSFKPFFAERVMQRIDVELRASNSAETFWEALYSAFRPVAIAGAILAIALVIYNSAKTDEVSAAAALGVSNVTLEEIMEPPVEAVWGAS